MVEIIKKYMESANINAFYGYDMVMFWDLTGNKLFLLRFENDKLAIEGFRNGEWELLYEKKLSPGLVQLIELGAIIERLRMCYERRE